ncbi:hypothetical protein BV20DRAFT_515177 [Pilatotrama ljubarskyi]|nr:hypothetical protein BV20DRAFT_515177 [Pilatotrama ljubarskyi]
MNGVLRKESYGRVALNTTLASFGVAPAKLTCSRSSRASMKFFCAEPYSVSAVHCVLTRTGQLHLSFRSLGPYAPESMVKHTYSISQAPGERPFSSSPVDALTSELRPTHRRLPAAALACDIEIVHAELHQMRHGLWSTLEQPQGRVVEDLLRHAERDHSTPSTGSRARCS